VALFTLYVAVTVIGWSARKHTLENAKAELFTELASAEQAVEAASANTEEFQAALERAQQEMLRTANLHVVADDHILIYGYVGSAMNVCVDESFDLAYTVRNKWTLASGYRSEARPFGWIHDYDDSVREYCQDVRKGFAEAVEDLQERISPQEASEEEGS